MSWLFIGGSVLVLGVMVAAIALLARELRSSADRHEADIDARITQAQDLTKENAA